MSSAAPAPENAKRSRGGLKGVQMRLRAIKQTQKTVAMLVQATRSLADHGIGLNAEFHENGTLKSWQGFIHAATPGGDDEQDGPTRGLSAHQACEEGSPRAQRVPSVPRRPLKSDAQKGSDIQNRTSGNAHKGMRSAARGECGDARQPLHASPGKSTPQHRAAPSPSTPSATPRPRAPATPSSATPPLSHKAACKEFQERFRVEKKTAVKYLKDSDFDVAKAGAALGRQVGQAVAAVEHGSMLDRDGSMPNDLKPYFAANCCLLVAHGEEHELVRILGEKRARPYLAGKIADPTPSSDEETPPLPPLFEDGEGSPAAA